MDTPSCATCLHFATDDNATDDSPTTGLCKRFPPTVIKPGDDGSFPEHPGVMGDDVCGEHPVLIAHATGAMATYIESVAP